VIECTSLLYGVGESYRFDTNQEVLPLMMLTITRLCQNIKELQAKIEQINPNLS